MGDRLGPRLDLGKPIAGTVFPNFSMLRPTSRTIRVWHPRGPEKTEVWAWIFVDKAAPPEVKKALRLAGARVFGPGGTFEQDDMDNWQGCTQTAPRAAWVRSEGTRLNSSHLGISYAVFCLKKKKQEMTES